MNITLKQGDCLELMADVSSGSVDLTVTSPPYDNLRAYNGYSFDFEGIARELFRVTAVGGVVVWVVSDQTFNGSESGTSFKQALYFKEIGFNLHDTMIWHKSNIPKTHNRYEQAFEYMFVFSKGKPKTFNPILVPSVSAGQKHTRGDKSASLSQKNSATKGITKSYANGQIKKSTRITDNVFYYSVGFMQTSKDPRTFEHPAPFPEQLAHDHIISWSNEGDLVFDPFTGSGTTGVAAVKLQRNFIGYELDKEYFELAQRRIYDASSEHCALATQLFNQKETTQPRLL